MAENSKPRHLEAYCEPIDVTSLHEPDMSWVQIDKAGHEHRWVGDWVTEATLPTLELIWDDPPGDDWPGVWHYECRECRDTVEPQTQPSSHRHYMRGPRSYYIDGMPVTEEEFKAAYAEMRHES